MHIIEKIGHVVMGKEETESLTTSYLKTGTFRFLNMFKNSKLME